MQCLHRGCARISFHTCWRLQVMDESGRFKEDNFKAMVAEAGDKSAAERSAGQASTSAPADEGGRGGRGRGRGGRCAA